jgi:P27 family predicted phage terminase small subunit
MARPGPAPTPTHLKIIRGTRPDRINKAEPKPTATEPKCPTWLDSNGKKVWRRVAKQLKDMGLLFEADQDVIVAYVQAVITHQAASVVVQNEGIVVPGRRDEFVKNPALQVVRDSATLVRMLAGELGLTPAARARLKATDDGGAQDLDSLLE